MQHWKRGFMLEKLKTQCNFSQNFIDLQYENNAILYVIIKRKDTDGQRISDLPIMRPLYELYEKNALSM
jgi:hypothetical protein